MANKKVDYDLVNKARKNNASLRKVKGNVNTNTSITSALTGNTERKYDNAQYQQYAGYVNDVANAIKSAKVKKQTAYNNTTLGLASNNDAVAAVRNYKANHTNSVSNTGTAGVTGAVSNTVSNGIKTETSKSATGGLSGQLNNKLRQAAYARTHAEAAKTNTASVYENGRNKSLKQMQPGYDANAMTNDEIAQAYSDYKNRNNVSDKNKTNLNKNAEVAQYYLDQVPVNAKRQIEAYFENGKKNKNRDAKYFTTEYLEKIRNDFNLGFFDMGMAQKYATDMADIGDILVKNGMNEDEALKYAVNYETWRDMVNTNKEQESYKRQLSNVPDNVKSYLEEYITAKNNASNSLFTDAKNKFADWVSGEDNSSRKLSDIEADIENLTGWNTARIDEYAKMYETVLDTANTEAEMAQIESDISEGGFGTSAKYTAEDIATFLPSALEGGKELFAQSVGAKNKNPYASGYEMINRNAAIEQAVTNKIENPVGKFAYGVGTSTAKSLESAMVGSSVAAGLCISASAAPIVSSMTTLPAFGVTSYQQAYKENIDKGMGESNAQKTAIASGISEMLFEVVSLDKLNGLFQEGGKVLLEKGIKGALKEVAVQAGIEGSEEGFTDIANWLADDIINGSYSDYQQNVKEYGKKEAQKMRVKELATDIAAGAASGGLSAAGAISSSFTNNVINAKQVLKNEESYNSLLEAGSKMDKDSKAYSLAMKGLSGEKLSVMEVADILASANGETSVVEAVKDDLVSNGMSENEADTVVSNVVKAVESNNTSNLNDVETEVYNMLTDEENYKNEKAALEVRSTALQAKSENRQNKPDEKIKTESLKTDDAYAENKGSIETTTKDGSDIKITGFANNNLDEVNVTENGKSKTLKLSDVNLKDASGKYVNNVAQIYNRAAILGDAKAANIAVENYKGQNVESYFNLGNKALLAGQIMPNMTAAEYSNLPTVAPYVTLNDSNQAYVYQMFERGKELRSIEIAKDREEASFTGNKNLSTFNESEMTNKDVKGYKEFKAIAEKVSKAIGVEIAVNDDSFADGGNFSDSLARITINYATSKDAVRTLIHEVGEFATSYNPSGMDELIGSVLTYMGKRDSNKLTADLTAYAQAYSNSGLKGEENKTIAQAGDEYVYDFIAGTILNENGMKDFANFLNKNYEKSTREKIIDAFKQILDNLVSFFESISKGDKQLGTEEGRRIAKESAKQAKQFRDMWFKAVEEASANLNAQASNKKAETQTNKKAKKARSMEVPASTEDSFTVESDGNVRLDPRGLSLSAWSKLAREFKKLGYDIKDGEQLKNIFTENFNNPANAKKMQGILLNPDQSNAVKKLFDIGVEAKETEMSFEEASKIAKKAEEEFGTTRKWDLAGYLDVNGKLLDFSQGQGYRVQDHREISNILDLPDDADYSDGLIEFMNEGNIRLQSYGFDISRMYNSAQKSMLRDFINRLDGEVTVDISNLQGGSICSVEYAEGTASSRVLNDIANFFETGDIPHGTADGYDYKYSLEISSEGNALTKGQIKYFEDSKVLDAEGRLLVMYHGSSEKFSVFDAKKARSGGLYGNGFYFSSSQSHAKTYGETYKVYLNIVNPLTTGTNNITKEQLTKFVQELADNEDYGIENYGYGATVDNIVENIISKDDFGIISDLNVTCVGNMVEAIKLFNDVNSAEYDGIIAPTETVAFYANQIKDVTNENPTKDNDIHHSYEVLTEDVIIRKEGKAFIPKEFRGAKYNYDVNGFIYQYEFETALEDRFNLIAEAIKKNKKLSFKSIVFSSNHYFVFDNFDENNFIVSKIGYVDSFDNNDLKGIDYGIRKKNTITEIISRIRNERKILQSSSIRRGRGKSNGNVGDISRETARDGRRNSGNSISSAEVLKKQYDYSLEIPSYNFSNTVAFFGTDEEIEAAQKREDEIVDFFKKIVEADDFLALRYRNNIGNDIILARSTRDGVKWQLSRMDNRGAIGHTEYKEGQDAKLYQDMTTEQLFAKDRNVEVYTTEDAKKHSVELTRDDIIHHELDMDLMQIIEDSYKDAIDILNNGAKALENIFINEDEVNKMAKEIIKNTSSHYSAEELASNLMKVFAYIKETNNASYDVLLDVVKEVATPVIEDVYERDRSTDTEWQAIREYLSDTKIALSPTQKKEVKYKYGGYNQYASKMFGTVKFSDSGSLLDTIWTELVDVSDGMLDYNTSDADQPAALYDLVDSYRPKQTNFGMDVENEAYNLAMDIFARFFKMQAAETNSQASKLTSDQLVKKAMEYRAKYKKTYEEELKKQKETLKKKKLDDLRNVLYKRDELATEFEKLKVSEGEDLDPLVEIEVNEKLKEYDDIIQKIKDQDVLKIAQQNARKVASKHKYDYAEARRRTALKNTLKSNVNFLNGLLGRPKNKQFIPTEMVKGIIDVVSSINLDTGKSKATAEKLKKLNDLYERYNNDSFAFDYDEKTQNNIKTLQTLFEGRNYTEFSNAELEMVVDLVKSIRTQIANTNKLLNMQTRENARQTAKEVNREIKDSRIAKNGVTQKLNKYIDLHLNAQRWFRKMSGYKENGAWMEAYKMIDDGLHKQMQIERKVNEIFADVLEGKENQKQLKKLTSTKKEDLVDIGLKDDNGNPVMVTRDMRLAVIMHSLNEGNMRHLFDGGLRVPNLSEYQSGKVKDAYGDGHNYRYVPYSVKEAAYENNNMAIYDAAVDEAEKSVKKLMDELSDYEKAFLKATQEFMWKYSGSVINETSTKLKGYALARVKNYFPIHVDSNFVNADVSGLVMDRTIEGQGFLKERIKSGKPIYLEGLTNVILRQTRSVSEYGGMAIPVRNMNMLLNVQLGGETLRKTIVDTWSQADLDYLTNLLADIQGGRNTSDSFDILRSKFAGSIFALNASVAIRQAASYPTAAAVLGYRSLAKTLVTFNPGKANTNGRFALRKGIKELEDINPLLWYRSQGYSTQELGDIKNIRGLKSVMPYYLDWISMFDIGTVRALEYASKDYVDRNFKSLEKGSEEYWQKVSDVFTKAVEETQPNYTTLQRADVAKRGGLWKYLVMFKTQSMQNFGIMYDATGNLIAKARANKLNKTDSTKAELKTARNQFAHALSSQLVSAAVYNIMGIVAASLIKRKWPDYEDEEGNVMWDELLKEVLAGSFETMSGSFVFGSEVYDMVTKFFTGETYYGTDIQAISGIEDIYTSLKNVYDAIQNKNEAVTTSDKEKSKIKLEKSLETLAGNIGYVTGIPVNNILTLLKNGFLYGEDAFTENNAFESKFKTANDIPSQKQLILDALISDDPNYKQYINEHGKKYVADNEGKTLEQAAESIMKSQKTYVKKLYFDGDISDDKAIKLLKKIGYDEETVNETMISWRKSIASDKLGDDYTMDQYIDAVESYGISDEAEDSAIKSELKKEYEAGKISDDKLKAYFKTELGMTDDEAYWNANSWKYGSNTGELKEAVAACVKSGNIDGTKLKKIIDEYKAHGKEGKDIPGLVTSDYKEDYLAGKNKANIYSTFLNVYRISYGCSTEEAKKKVNSLLHRWYKDQK